MLVLSRKVGQKIAIGDDVVLVINRIAGNRVSIGIHAPNQLRIVRGELEPHALSVYRDGETDFDDETAGDCASSEDVAPDHRAPEASISPGSKAVVVGWE